MRINLPDQASIISGSDKNLSVCPVGAVSKTITSQFGSSTCLSNSSKAKASSNPGRIISEVWISDFISSISSLALESSIILNPPKPPIPPLLFIPSTIFPNFGRRFEILDSGSISRPNKPSTPSIGVGSVPMSTPKESDVECAGSLETMRTFSPESANQTAVAAEVVVLPTPPLPPNNSSLAITRPNVEGL